MYIHLVFTIALSNNKLFYPHFWDEDIEATRDKVTDPRGHTASKQAGPVLGPRRSRSRAGQPKPVLHEHTFYILHYQQPALCFIFPAT